MIFHQGIIVFDLSAMVLMLILSNLSKRLGEALKIAPFYRLLFVTAGMMFCAAALDAARGVIQVRAMDLVTVVVRITAGVCAAFACLPYWKWLFTEYFYKK